MEEKLYGILRKHKLPLKKRDALMVDLLNLFSVSNSDDKERSRFQKDIDDCYANEDEENARAAVCDTTGYADCQHWQDSSFGCSGCNKTFKKQTDY